MNHRRGSDAAVPAGSSRSPAAEQSRGFSGASPTGGPDGGAGGDLGPVERHELAHPDLPPGLDGLTLVHITDTHARDHGQGLLGAILPFKRGGAVRRLPGVLAKIDADLVLLTGDYMDHPGDEKVGLACLKDQARAWRARFGAFGVFGNHDTAAFQEMAREGVPGVRWLENRGTTVEIRGERVRILGASEPEDMLGAGLSCEDGPAAFTIALAHFPTQVYPAAQLGVHLVLAGHTHGGQVRLKTERPLHTSCDLPGELASGVVRLGRTLCAIGRGLGETVIDFRLNCPPQLGVYTLRRGAFAGGDEDGGLTRVVVW